MEKFIGLVSLLVRDYDEALDFYTHTLGFEKVEDKTLSSEKRWVVIKPPNSNEQGCRLLLAKASNTSQEYFIGNQTGGRVFLFLYTDDIIRDYHVLQNKGVQIFRPLREEPYGKVLVFSDLYGNLWDLIELNESSKADRRRN